jgi:hypothetical protein
MKKTMIYLPDELHGYLAREAQEQDTSMAALVREAIAEYRTRKSELEPSDISAIFGCIPDDRPETDFAQRVDEGLSEYFAPGGQWDQENGL